MTITKADLVSIKELLDTPLACTEFHMPTEDYLSFLPLEQREQVAQNLIETYGSLPPAVHIKDGVLEAMGLTAVGG